MIIGISGKLGSGKDTVAKMFQLCEEMKYVDVEWKHYVEQLLAKNDFNSFRGDASGWEIKKFATKLKLQVADMLGIPVANLEKEEVKNSLLPDSWQIWEVFNFGHPTTNTYATEAAAKIFCNIRNNSHHNYTYKKTERTVRWLMQDWGTRCGRGCHPNLWINSLFIDYIPEVTSNWLVTDTRFLNEAEAVKARDGILVRVERPGLTTGDHASEVELDDYNNWDLVINNDSDLRGLWEKVKHAYETNSFQQKE